MTLVMIIGLAATAITLVFAGRRVHWLYRLITSGQPAPDRIQGVTGRVGLAVKTQLVEVFGQKKLLKWSIPGAAHFFVFWAFLILGTVYFEAYAVLITRDVEWSWLVFNSWGPLGFLQDFIAVMCLLGIIAFWQIRVKNSPEKLGRKSRFSGSHLGGAYFVLFMIFNVLWTLFLFRGAVAAHDMTLGEGHGYGPAAFVSYGLGKVLPDSEVLIGIGLLLHLGVMLVFLIDVLHSKHLHIFLAPLNVLFGRRPMALGGLKPLMSDGKPITLDDIDDLDEDAKLGVGVVEDLTWKGMLDLSTCTECGRCQDQCPAWNTEKPLSPKMVILQLRDHATKKAPYLMAGDGSREGLSDTVVAEVDRPLVGETEGWAWEPTGGAVIDTDVLWSCVTCGACVNQCPVDIEHVDHIVDMRRYQVLVESNFPAELNQLFKGMENKGNPWNMSSTARMDWAKDLPFDVKQVGQDIESLDEVEWLFWVGCAGAYEDRAKKTTRAVAELLDMAGVTFGVLGNGETCTGDSARRAGNEFLFQGLAQQNIETFKEYKVKKVVSTCAHCFNTLKNEYKEFGIELEVVHHTQLLNRLVREGKLTPVSDGAGAAKRSITYHDPCYIGRHNGVYTPPRELLQIMPGAEFVEMERNSERSFCCGAGGARMWMEETIGQRINVNRTKEAVGTGADQIAVGCPFCRVMLADGLLEEQQNGNAREEVEVLDVAQMLLASVKGESATRARTASKKATVATGGGGGSTDVATKAEPEAGDVTATEDTVTDTADAGPAAKASGGSSLFDTPADSATADKEATPTEEAEAAASAPSSGGSLFDTPADTPAEKPAPTSEKAAEPAAETTSQPSSGGSLFDLGADEPAAPAKAESKPAESKQAESKQAESKPADEPVSAERDSGGGSLFDIAGPAEDAPKAMAGEEPADEVKAHADAEKVEKADAEPEAKPTATEPEADAAKAPEPEADASQAAAPAQEIGSGSLFDLAAPEQPPAEKDQPAEEPAPSPQPSAPTPSEEVEEDREEEAEAATDTAGDGKPDAAALSQAATAASSGTEAEAEAQDEKPQAEKPKSSGETHQPKTDVDINEGSSLFDL